MYTLLSPNIQPTIIEPLQQKTKTRENEVSRDHHNNKRAMALVKHAKECDTLALLICT